MATRIPINKDNYQFEDRQKSIWEDMEHDMERRRREWEGEIDKMRSDFFHMRPEKAGAPLDFDRRDGPPAGLTPRLPAGITNSEDGKPVVEKDEHGMPFFKVRFDMKEYRPEEVNVKMDTNKIIVSARHEEKTGGSSVSREYNREVNVPAEVDPLALQCLFQPDGYLVFSAPLPAPKYDAIKEAPGHSSPSVKSSSSSYHSSSSNNNKMNGGDGGMISHSPQPTLHHQIQMNHRQPPKVQHISHQHAAAPPSYPKQAASPPSFHQPSTSSSKFSSLNSSENPDHIVPMFRPPPDIGKLLDGPVPLPKHHHSSPMVKPPPFTNLSSTFPAGPIFTDSSKQIQLSVPTVTSHDGKFQLTMPIDDFKPEELTVKTQDRNVIICARREVMTGSRNHTMEMNREHGLPDNVDPLTVKAFFTDTNMLIVEAPFLRG